MKIGFLIESMAVASGGPSRVAGVVASGLVERGHEVVIGTLPRASELVQVDPRVKIELIAGTIRNPLNWFRAVAGIRRLADKVDVILVSGIWGPVDGLALRLANIKDIPVHIRICGMLEDYILQRNPARKWIGRRAYLDRNLCGAKSLVVNTRIEKSHVEGLGIKTPIHVIPNGVNLPCEGDCLERGRAMEVLGLTFPTTDKVLLYLSRIHPKKGLHVLLESIGSILCERPDWHVLIAGDFFEGEGYRERINGLVKASGVAERIHFVGEVASERKRAAYSLSDLFILPSESEGFSNAVIEALSWFIPAIITEGCNFPEVEEARAGWITKFDPIAIDKVVKNAMDYDEERRVMGKNARGLIERSFQQRHIIDLYEKLLVG